MKLSRAEIESFFHGYMAGTVADYQMSAFLMAVYFQRMDFEETTHLTDLMLRSGRKADLSFIPGKKVGKHSTGGVGDKLSLIIAPMVASCGVSVPMVSGRGLGHTGGTLDKLGSIPGFRVNLSLAEYTRILSETGVVMVGQTEEIVPVDRKIYALRDVTGSIESVPLIAASIMSKKLAEGTDALVLDVKTGNGAFMQSESAAAELAQTLIEVGKKFGLKSIAFLTNMNQPLGYAAGNWLEVRECVDCLRGKKIPDVMEVSYVLGGAMVFLGGMVGSIDEGISMCRKEVGSGKAWEKFIELVQAQGGDVKYLHDPDLYGEAEYTKDVVSTTSGAVNEIDTREIGLIGILLGSGRMRIDDQVDPSAGIIMRKKSGDRVEAGEPLATLYTGRRNILDVACKRTEAAFRIGEERFIPVPLVRSVIDEEGIHEWRGGA